MRYADQIFEFTKEGLISFSKLFLRKAFDVREGEISRVLLMQANIFLLISSILILKPTVNSLFLSKFGAENLPNAFLLVALFAAIISSVYSRKLKVTPLNKIIITTILFSIFIFFVFWLLLEFNFLEGWVLYLFYIWVSIFAVLSASQFWILANVVFNTREAKRLFGFIGAGAIAGGIFGGYLTSVLAYLISSENLLLVSMFLLSLCVPITKKIWISSVTKTQTPFQQSKRLSGFSDHPLKLIRNSRHLTYLASIICVSVIVAKLVDYQFSAIASENIKDPDALTAFFGFWFSNMNLVSLFVQLFITRKVVGVLGVGTSLFFLPAGIFLGAVAVFFVPEIWAAIFLKISDGSLKQSVNKAGIELLALPIPLEIKNQTKSFIDVVIDSIASGLGGLMLVLLVIGLGLSPRFVSILIIIHLIVWLYLVTRIRKEYIRSFKLKVEQAKTGTQKTFLDLSDESVIGGLIKVLEKGSEKQILFVLGKIKEIPNDKFFPPLVKLINHSSDLVRLEALKNLYFYRNKNLVDEIKELVNDSNTEVKTAAFEYLFEHGGINIIQFMKPYLNSSDYKISQAALLSLAVETRDNPELKKEFSLSKMVKTKLEETESIKDSEKILFVKMSCLKSIGSAKLEELYSEISDSFGDEDLQLVEQAIISAGQTMDAQFIHNIINFLDHDKLNEAARRALLNYGSAITEVLVTMANDNNITINKRRIIPSVFERIGDQNTVNNLFQLLDHEDLIIRNESLRGLNTLMKNHPYLKINKKEIVKKIMIEAKFYNETIAELYSQMNADQLLLNIDNTTQLDSQREARKSLIDLLERRLDRNLERIFRLLGLKYPPDDMITIYKGVQSKKPDLRVNAIEFLDNLLEPNLKRIIIPIIETAMLDTISEEAIANLKIRVPDEDECIEMLMKGKDLKVKLAVLYLISQLKDDKYRSLVEDYINSSDIKIKTYAIKALESLSNN